MSAHAAPADHDGAAAVPRADGRARGVVGLGDSITVGEGEPVQGVRILGWAHWVALALDEPYHQLARNGALAPEVLADLAPRLAGPYALAGVFAGANDVRSDPFDPAAYRATMSALVGAAAEHAERVVVLTIPEDLGRPRCAPKPFVGNGVLREVAAEHGALVVELTDLAGRRLILPDAVHPTALGQVEIATRVLRVLADDGLPAPVDAWELAEPFPGLRAVLAAERRWLRGLWHDVRRRRYERRHPPRVD